MTKRNICESMGEERKRLRQEWQDLADLKSCSGERAYVVMDVLVMKPKQRIDYGMTRANFHYGGNEIMVDLVWEEHRTTIMKKTCDEWCQVIAKNITVTIENKDILDLSVDSYKSTGYCTANMQIECPGCPFVTMAHVQTCMPVAIHWDGLICRKITVISVF
jgi:hypothetical protein